MSTDTSTTPENETRTFEKGSWQESLSKSTVLLDRSTKARKAASNLLWSGAQSGIESWLPTADTDVSAENLYAEVLDILGTPRKGDASKIKTVALAVKNHGLSLAAFPNLSKAYAEATRLTKTVQTEAAEDDAAEEAIAKIEAPKTTGSIEGAAALLLSKGVDGAVVAILDALGADNEAAHRAFMRAVSTEIAARVQAKKPKPAPKAGPKAGATQATGTTTAAKKATVKSGATKAKPAKTAATATKAKPVPTSATKGDPNKRMLPPAADKGEPVTEPVHAGDDVPAEATAEVVPAENQTAPVKRRAVPVKRA